ncbi:glycosyltransferase [Falsigemmobacter faecalis]|uniref:Glycosyltransferase n=1 Tax=Falsigemmobacter faecalis TaxID=2488730 RepID=A0A3P3DMT5_9RHOB|nr:glycosyltransferase [Falsigemmobacter faecalis]RRH75481.1 glycosyltransferase [Falsigemmobacter faecalis]
MKILFVHQNFPGQFLHLAPELQRRGHQVLALTDAVNTRASPVRVVRYHAPAEAPDPVACRLGRAYTEASDRGVAVARAARALRDRHGFVPDVIFGHSGWGETLFLKTVWPEARLLIYAEFFYQSEGADTGFDSEFESRPDFERAIVTEARRTHLATALLGADAALAPTQWQASTFPPALRSLIEVGFDGVDTDLVRPDGTARLTLPDGRPLRAGDEVLSFVNRNLEPYRGWHIFARALPAVLAARPEARVVIVGGEGTSYGAAPPQGSWKEVLLRELEGRIDLTRVHFTGRLPYADFLRLMQITRVHAYLTYPFVLSWSMAEAMAAGALVVASDTAPVREFVTDGVTGRLVDFFDVAGWSAALTEALANPAAALPLRRAARGHMVAHYDLRRVCLPQIVKFVEAQTAPRSPRSQISARTPSSAEPSITS